MHNILFIGGAGFIGSSIIKELKPFLDGEIYVLEPLNANLSRLENLEITVFRASLSDIDFIEQIIRTRKVSKVVHLVSTMVPGCGYDEYKQEFENVIFPTVRLMQLCSRENVQFVYFSSGGTVYGERTTIVPFKESDPKEPISYYGLSKQTIENGILFEHRVSDLDYLIIRPSNPYGPGQNINGRQGLIAVALGKVLRGETIIIWGDGSSIRDYIYIDDLAKIVAKLIMNNIKNKIVNIGSGSGATVKEIIDLISTTTKENVKVEYTPGRKNDVSNMILDTSFMNTLVNIELTSLECGITRFYEFEKGKLLK